MDLSMNFHFVSGKGIGIVLQIKTPPATVFRETAK
jgi:hypothetical protein